MKGKEQAQGERICTRAHVSTVGLYWTTMARRGKRTEVDVHDRQGGAHEQRRGWIANVEWEGSGVVDGEYEVRKVEQDRAQDEAGERTLARANLPGLPRLCTGAATAAQLVDLLSNGEQAGKVRKKRRMNGHLDEGLRV